MRLVLSFVLFLSVGCGFTFERSSLVLDRRVATLVSEPAEIIAGVLMPEKVRVTALVIEPGAPSTPVAFEWRVCLPAELSQPGVTLPYPPADTLTGRCPENAASLILSGESPADSLAVDVPVPPELGLILMAATQSGAAISMYVTVQLKVESERGDLFAMKRIVLSPALPAGRVANENPRLLGLVFDGRPWSADAPVELQWNACPESDRVVVVEDEREVKVCEHRVDPLFDSHDAQSYQVLALKRSPEEPERILDLQEQLAFAWFVDAGQVSRQTTRTPQQLALQEYDPLSTRWREPSTRPDGVVNLWVVVRDGRGGSDFTRRQVTFVP